MGKDEKKKLVRDHHKTSNNANNKKNNKKSKKTPKKEEKPPTPVKKTKPEKFIKKSKTLNNDDGTGQEVQKKPGQKYPEPSLDDPTRAFYETLYEQKSESPMAQKYCLEYGLLSEDVAQTISAKFKKNK